MALTSTMSVSRERIREHWSAVLWSRRQRGLHYGQVPRAAGDISGLGHCLYGYFLRYLKADQFRDGRQFCCHGGVICAGSIDCGLWAPLSTLCRSARTSVILLLVLLVLFLAVDIVAGILNSMSAKDMSVTLVYVRVAGHAQSGPAVDFPSATSIEGWGQ